MLLYGGAGGSAAISQGLVSPSAQGGAKSTPDPRQDPGQGHVWGRGKRGFGAMSSVHINDFITFHVDLHASPVIRSL